MTRLPPAKQVDPLESKRTWIPILLSCGTILVLVGVFVLLSGPETAMSDLFPAWAAIILTILGVLTLVLAALNMLHVKQHSTPLKK